MSNIFNSNWVIYWNDGSYHEDQAEYFSEKHEGLRWMKRFIKRNPIRGSVRGFHWNSDTQDVWKHPHTGQTERLYIEEFDEFGRQIR